MSHVGSSRSGAVVGAAGPPAPSPLDALRRAWPAYVVLACTLLLTFGAWRYAERTVRANEQDRFDRVVAMSRATLDRRLESYLQILMGVRALFASSTAVERSEFRSFVTGLSLDDRYPSIRGMSWVPRIPAGSKASHEALMRRGGAPAGYEIHPAEGRAEFHPAAFLEPAEAYDARWFGFDVATLPENREAMERARDPGSAGAPRELNRTVPVLFGGQTWTLHFATQPAFHSLAERLVPYWVLGSGLLISVLAFVTTLLPTRALTAARRLGAELQTAERRLRRANERFELAASAVSSAIYDLNLQHRTVAWTQGITELCGYRLDETDSTYEWWIERIHPDDRLRVRERFQTAMASGVDFEAEYRFRARDGHYLDVLDRGRLLRDAGGRSVRVVGSMADVSERKRGESVLRESEARHRAVLETAMDAFVAMDHDGRVIEFNPAAERMFGHTRADVIGRELAEVIIPPAFQDAHRRGLLRYLANGEHTLLGR